MAADSFPYGASYYPLVYDESEWARDLDLMAGAGFNLVRTGDVHGGWDRIEPEPGRLRLDLLEQFYRLAAARGIRVLLTTGIASPPIWLLERHPDVRIISSRGEPYPQGASYHWACIHHPGYLEAAGRYTGALARWAPTQPNHFGWQVSNEIGFPFLPTRERDVLDLFCYCGHCKARFRQWLAARYGSLEELSRQWLWSTTAFQYTAWEQVQPPEALPGSWSGVTMWIDWRLFWQEQFARFAAWQHRLIRAGDPAGPTSLNTFNFKGYDRFGTFTGLDQWQLVEQVDHLGYDLYPGSGAKLLTRPEHSSMFLDHGRSVSAFAGKDFWIHELESGPIGGWVLGPEHNTGPDDILRYAAECLGHGARLMLYMGWKEWDYQSLHWGGLVDLDSEPTPRLAATRQVGEYLRANAAFLSVARVPQGEVALVESKPNAIFFRGIDQEEELFHAQRGAYRACWELGYRVDFASPQQVLDGALAAYPVVCLPLLAAVSPALGEALGRYVEQGGLLVGFARTGAIDERGWYHRRLPVPGLREAFGLRVPESERGRDLQVSLGDRDYPGHLQRDLVLPDPGTEVLGRFADGRPAVLLHRHGQGYGLYIATRADSGAGRHDSPLLKEALRRVLEQRQIRPAMTLTCPGMERREIDPHLLAAPGRYTVLLACYRQPAGPVRIQLAVPGTVTRAEAGLLTKTPVPYSQHGGLLDLRLDLADKAVEGVDVYWDQG